MTSKVGGKKLPPGTYTITVKAKNSVGTSAAKTLKLKDQEVSLVHWFETVLNLRSGARWCARSSRQLSPASLLAGKQVRVG